MERAEEIEQNVEKRTLLEALVALRATPWQQSAIASIWHTAGFKHAMATIKGWKGEQT